MKDGEKAAQQQTSYTSIATQLPPPTNYSEISIPADGDCLYTTIFIGYLLPVINVKNDFISRLRKLIGPWSLLLKNASELRNWIINSLQNVNELKHSGFKEYILAFRKGMRLDDKKWGGPEEIKIIAKNLDIGIQEYTENPDLNSQSNQHYILLDNTNPSSSTITINILRTTASGYEILQATDDLAIFKTKAESLDSSQNRQHYRLLSSSQVPSLNAGKTPIPPPNKNVQKSVPISTTTTLSDKAEESPKESHSRLESNPHIETEVDDVEPLFRRYDSFAWLIQGNDQCGAAYFDGTTLFLATNNNEESAIYKRMIQYLHDTALTALNCNETISQTSEQKRNQQIADFIDARVQDIAEVILLANKFVTIFNNEEYITNFIRSLFKVTFSIISSFLDKYFKEYVKTSNTKEGWLYLKGKASNAAFYLLDTIKSSRRYEHIEDIIGNMFSIEDWILPYEEDDQEVKTLQQRAFPKKLVDAMLNPKKINYLQSDVAGVHAELKILEKIIEQYGILDNQNRIIKEKVKGLPQQYIGISKRCCLNCELTIKAVNNVLKEYGLKHDFIRLRTKKGSRGRFNATPPSFLGKQEKFKTEFLRLRKHRTLKKAFSEPERNHIPGSEQNQRRSKQRSKDANPNKRHVTRKLRTAKTKRKDRKQVEESMPIHGTRRISRDKWQFYSTSSKNTSLISAPTLQKLQNILKATPIKSESLNETTIEIRSLKTHQNSKSPLKEIKALLTDLPEAVKKVKLSEDTENFVLTIETTNPKWKESLETVLMERQTSRASSHLSIERI